MLMFSGCLRPQVPANGNLKPELDVYFVGQPIQFECENGFELVGAEFIECLNTGLWSTDVPQCNPSKFLFIEGLFNDE